MALAETFSLTPQEIDRLKKLLFLVPGSRLPKAEQVLAEIQKWREAFDREEEAREPVAASLGTGKNPLIRNAEQRAARARTPAASRR